MGYDVVFAQSRPAPVIQLSYEKQNRFIDPSTSKTYIYPDQATVPSKSVSPEAIVEVFRSVNEIAVSQSSKMRFAVPIPFTAATASVGVQVKINLEKREHGEVEVL